MIVPLLAVLLQCPDGSPPPCRAAGARPPATNSVAVLYFENVTRDSGDAYLADGLTEAIIVRLGQVGRLEVKSRGVVRRFRESQLEPGSLGRQLGAAHLVSGSVRRSGQRLRVTVELVRSATGNQLWAQQFDRAGTDLLAIEEDIASAVATAIAGRLLPGERSQLTARPTRSPAAYDHYLRGNFLLARRTPVAIRAAISAYEQAAIIDPTFAGVPAREAFAYTLITSWDIPDLSRDTAIARGLRAASRALLLDSSSSDAWLGHGVIIAASEPSRYPEAVRNLDRSLALDSTNAEAAHLRAWFLAILGRDEEARSGWLQSLRHDPSRAVTWWYLSQQAHRQRDAAEACRLADSAIAVDREFSVAYAQRAMCRARLGQFTEARRDVGRAESLSTPGAAWSVIRVAAMSVHAAAGDTGTVRTILRQVEAEVEQLPISRSQALAAGYALLGETSRGAEVLRQMPRTHPAVVIFFGAPEYEALRSTQEFHDLLSYFRSATR